MTDSVCAGAASAPDTDTRDDEPSSRLVVAEMNTHHFMFRGAGHSEAEARTALLRAWTRHRTALVARYPERATSLPEEGKMEEHFRIYFLEFDMDAGYRDGERLV